MYYAFYAIYATIIRATSRRLRLFEFEICEEEVTVFGRLSVCQRTERMIRAKHFCNFSFYVAIL